MICPWFDGLFYTANKIRRRLNFCLFIALRILLQQFFCVDLGKSKVATEQNFYLFVEFPRPLRYVSPKTVGQMKATSIRMGHKMESVFSEELYSISISKPLYIIRN